MILGKKEQGYVLWRTGTSAVVGVAKVVNGIDETVQLNVQVLNSSPPAIRSQVTIIRDARGQWVIQ